MPTFWVLRWIFNAIFRWRMQFLAVAPTLLSPRRPTRCRGKAFNKIPNTITTLVGSRRRGNMYIKECTQGCLSACQTVVDVASPVNNRRAKVCSLSFAACARARIRKGQGRVEKLKIPRDAAAVWGTLSISLTHAQVSCSLWFHHITHDIANLLGSFDVCCDLRSKLLLRSSLTRKDLVCRKLECEINQEDACANFQLPYIHVRSWRKLNNLFGTEASNKTEMSQLM